MANTKKGCGSFRKLSNGTVEYSVNIGNSKEAFAENDVENILKFAETDELFGIAIYIMLHTGIRSQEMRALTIDKIDFQNGVVTIDTAVKRNGELGLPKNSIRITATSSGATIMFPKRDFAVGTNGSSTDLTEN